MRTLKHWSFTLTALALASACGGRAATPEPAPSATAANTGGEQLGTGQALTNVPPSAEPPAPPPPPPVRVVAGERTPLPAGNTPRVAITAPRDNSVARTNRVEVRLRVTDWPAPQDMRHVHLIVDNEPYRRIDDPSRPVVLENLSEGTHVLRAFPGWGSHESVKTPGAFAVSVFHVGRRSADFTFDRRAPLLTYSRPKGEYAGADAERVLLDFYVSNVPSDALSATGHRVRYAIDGALTGEATSWAPHFIENLPSGPHTIVLELLGPDGALVPGPFNRTERTITIVRGAPGAAANPCAMGHGHEGHGAAPSAAPSAAPANPCAPR